MKSVIIVSATILALAIASHAAAQRPAPVEPVPAPTTEGPDQLALFKDLKIDAVADKLVAGCKARYFTAERTDTRVTCSSTRLAMPADGAFTAKAGQDAVPTFTDRFVFVVAPVGTDSAVLEKSYRVRSGIRGTPPPPTEAEKRVAADIKARVGRFLTEMGGILQALPPPAAKP